MLRASAGFGSNTPLTPGQISAQGGVIILGNQGLPMVMPGSGLMVANGAGTLTTALAAAPTITKCYAYFALNAIATGVPAGWYYTVFTTTTAFTVFNNTYTTGTPAIPASPTAFSTTSPVSYTGASSQQAAYQLSIPGGTVGLNGSLTAIFSAVYTNSAATKTLQIAYSSLSLGSENFTTTLVTSGFCGFINQGATNAQITTGLVSGFNFGSSTNGYNTAAIDTTIAQTLVVNLTNGTPATNNLVLLNTTVELLPSVT